MITLSQPNFLSNGYRHIAFDEIESTNLIALDYAHNADPGKLWITAKKQSRGKGSRGRMWVSKPGNLYASLLISTDIPPDKLANLTFVASLAVYDSLKKILPEKQLDLKWPNDLLLNHAKISGILLENHPRHNQNSAVIIGVGVNCNSNPDNTNYPATNILKAGYVTEPEIVFQYLVSEMNYWLDIWDNGMNFSTIRTEWLDRAIGVGKEITVKMPRHEMHGIFEKLDLNGCLILKTADNRLHTISSADIFISDTKV